MHSVSGQGLAKEWSERKGCKYSPAHVDSQNFNFPLFFSQCLVAIRLYIRSADLSLEMQSSTSSRNTSRCLLVARHHQHRTSDRLNGQAGRCVLQPQLPRKVIQLCIGVLRIDRISTEARTLIHNRYKIEIEANSLSLPTVGLI